MQIDGWPNRIPPDFFFHAFLDLAPLCFDRGEGRVSRTIMRAMPGVGCLADGCSMNELLLHLGLICVPVLEGTVRFRVLPINKSLRRGGF